MFETRAGEQKLSEDPAAAPGDARVVFIGRIRSPWTDRSTCPKNMRAARETGLTAELILDEPYRRGLAGLDGVSHIVVLTWLHYSPRDLIVQKPRHATTARGVFALRSPARPNPVGMHVVRLVSVDHETGTVSLDAIDVLDGTPVIDIKPYFASIDAFPDATRPSADGPA